MKAHRRLFFAGLLGVAVFIPAWLVGSRILHTMLVHEVSTSLYAYRYYHEGRMPDDLKRLVKFDQRSSDSVPRRKARRWTQFAYVSHLRTNDPPTTPVFFDLPDRWFWGKGMVSYYGGGARWLPRSTLERLIREPWILNSDDFRTPEALEDFKRRARVILPEAGAVRSQQSTVEDDDLGRQ